MHLDLNGFPRALGAVSGLLIIFTHAAQLRVVFYRSFDRRLSIRPHSKTSIDA
jgi:hypothetical protein